MIYIYTHTSRMAPVWSPVIPNLSIRQPRLWSNCSPRGFQDDRADLHTPAELAQVLPFQQLLGSVKKYWSFGKKMVRIRSSSKKLDGMIWHNPSSASWLLIALSLKLCVFHWGITAPIGYHTIPSGNAGFFVNLLSDPAPLPLKSFP